MKTSAKSIVLLTLVLLLLAVCIVPNKSVYAGSNGQRLYIRTGMPFASVSVTGPNQDGVSTTWSSKANIFGDAITYNYWWKGEVKVGVFGPVAWSFRKVNVPKTWNGDYTVKW